MDLSKLRSKLTDSMLVKQAVSDGILHLDEVNKDSYLKCGYYFDDKIYVVTASLLVSEPRIIRNKDLPDFAFDLIVREGRCLLFDSVTHIKIKPLGRKDFVTVTDGLKLPYGIFEFDDGFKYGMPIVVVEGQKDWCVARRFYPYVIAAETATLSTFQRLFLSSLTDKLVIATDNDESGINGARMISRDKRFKCDRFTYPEGMKDLGDLMNYYLDDEFTYEYYRSFIETEFKVLCGGN